MSESAETDPQSAEDYVNAWPELAHTTSGLCRALWVGPLNDVWRDTETFDLEFDPSSTDAISGLIKADSDEFERLRMRMPEQSEDLGASSNGGASTFTDGIG